ncbi:MAG: protein-export chaperone SecB, partial [Pseudomonadota bacterium]
QQQPQVQMRVLGQFIRDMSFENVMAQKGVALNGQPEIGVEVNLDAKKRSREHQYEVALKLNVTSKAKDTGEAVFLMELDYCGVFHVQGVPEEQMHPFLHIECPRMLFPYVRRIVGDVSRDGGFPPLNLEQIDFVSMYRRRLGQMEGQQQPEQKTDA